MIRDKAKELLEQKTKEFNEAKTHNPMTIEERVTYLAKRMYPITSNDRIHQNNMIIKRRKKERDLSEEIRGLSRMQKIDYLLIIEDEINERLKRTN